MGNHWKTNLLRFSLPSLEIISDFIFNFVWKVKILFIASHCLASFRTASPLSLKRDWGRGVGCLRSCEMWLFIGTMWSVGTLAPGLWRASLVAQTVKNPSAMWETPVQSLHSHEEWKILWRRGWLPTPVSCWENSIDRGAWQAIVHGVTELDKTEQLTLSWNYYKKEGAL
jgi:hypothetical protein